MKAVAALVRALTATRVAAVLRRSPAPVSSEAGEFAERLGALLAGGVPPHRAVALLTGDSSAAGTPSEAGSVASTSVLIARRVAQGVPIATALAAVDHAAWRVLAVAWQLASDSGAPLAPALQRIALALSELERTRERRSVLLAGPRATVRMVAALPVLALLLGLVLGFDPIPVLFSVPGALIAAVGIGMLLVGVRWSSALHLRAAAADRVAGLSCELLWIALGGGAPPLEGCRRVVDATDRYAAEWVAFDDFRDRSPLRLTIAAAGAAGVPIRPLLIEQARAERIAVAGELERSAERLGVRVLLPLGICVLPSFIVLGVVPVLLSMFGAM